MKFVKYTLVLVAILVIGFFAIGLIKSKLTYDCQIVVNKPVEETWAVSQDPEKLSEWLTGFQQYEHVSGTPGTVGAVAKVHFISEGEKMVITEKIVDVKPNESITMNFMDDFMTMDYTMTVANENGKSKINSSTNAKGNNLIARSIMALVSGTMKEQENTNLRKLKTAIEKNTKVYTPSADKPKQAIL